MDFARQHRDPKRHLVGIGFVVLIHALVVYALMTGLARKAVEVIKKPVTATIIQEIKPPPPPPPPPPPKKIVEAPPVKPPPQPYVPPPDIPPPAPPQEAPVITSVAPTPPAEPYVITPPAPPVVIEAPPAPPAPPPKPAVRRGITPIKREDPVYPRLAIRAGIEKGQVIAQLQIDESGNVTDVKIVSANPPRHFEGAVKDALINWKFAPDGTRYTGIIEVNFTLKD